VESRLDSKSSACRLANVARIPSAKLLFGLRCLWCLRFEPLAGDIQLHCEAPLFEEQFLCFLAFFGWFKGVTCIHKLVGCPIVRDYPQWDESRRWRSPNNTHITSQLGAVKSTTTQHSQKLENACAHILGIYISVSHFFEKKCQRSKNKVLLYSTTRKRQLCLVGEDLVLVTAVTCLSSQNLKRAQPNEITHHETNLSTRQKKEKKENDRAATLSPPSEE
jgi:hypothetical protein